MKLRKLRTILNEPNYLLYLVGDVLRVERADRVAIISMNIQTLKMVYGLAPPEEDAEKAMKGYVNVEFIWYTLKSMIADESIREIINGFDDIEEPYPIYSFSNGRVIKSSTDRICNSNITKEGFLIEGNWFPSREEALSNALTQCEWDIRRAEGQISSLKNEIQKTEIKHSKQFILKNYLIEKLKEEKEIGFD